MLYLKSDGKWWKANATTAATSAGKLRIAPLNGAATAIQWLMKTGTVNPTTAFPAGTIGGAAVLSTVDGKILNIADAPTGTDTVTRIIGYFNSATELDVDISQNYITHV